MIKPVDIKAALATLTPLRGRRSDTPSEQTRAAFATLAPFREGYIFTGTFSGDSDWERHRQGDELVQVLDGATELTVLTAEGPQTFALTAGMVVVVPQGHWHRFHAPDGVTLLTATPQPTDHTRGADPPVESP